MYAPFPSCTQGQPQQCSFRHFQVWFLDGVKGMGGKREPSLTLSANVTGCVLLEAVQRGTGANLISFCLDWQALLRPPSAWVPPLKRVGRELFSVVSVLLLLHIKTCLRLSLPFPDNVKYTFTWYFPLLSPLLHDQQNDTPSKQRTIQWLWQTM